MFIDNVPQGILELYFLSYILKYLSKITNF